MEFSCRQIFSQQMSWLANFLICNNLIGNYPVCKFPGPQISFNLIFTSEISNHWFAELIYMWWTIEKHFRNGPGARAFHNCIQMYSISSAYIDFTSCQEMRSSIVLGGGGVQILLTHLVQSWIFLVACS